MADGNINLGIQVNLQDAGASAGLNKLSKEAEAAATKSSTRATQAGRQQLTETAKLAASRSTLGIRAERDIQAEINKTVRSYERLASSGKLSMAELARAHDATKQKVTALINESGRLTKEQEKQARGDRRRAIGQKAMIGIGGVVAAAATLKAPIIKAINYDKDLADLSNIVGAGESVEVRQKMMKQMEQGIIEAYRHGGSTRDDVLRSLQTILASGAIESDANGSALQKTLAILPSVAKYATASNSDINDVGRVMAVAMKQFGFKKEEAAGVLNSMLLGGAYGSFEVKDLASALPEQLPEAKRVGLYGSRGFSRLVGWNEAAANVAGTPGEAATMVSAAMGDINSPSFMRYMASAFYNKGVPLGRKKSIAFENKLQARFVEYQKQGIDRAAATAIMMDEILSKNKVYASLKNQLKTIDPKKDSDKYQNIAAAMEQQSGLVFGKVFHNKESRMGILAAILGSDLVNKLETEGSLQWNSSQKEGDLAFENIKNTPWFQTQLAVQDSQTAQKAAMDNLTPAIGAVAKGFSSITMAYPGLVGGTITAGTALATFAGAVGTATFALRMLGAGSVPGAITTTGGIVGRGKGANILPIAAKGGKIMRAGGTLAIGMTAASLGGMALDSTFGAESGISKYGSAALNGAAVGATIGSLVPVAGTGIGAGVGAIGGILWQAVSDALKDEKGGLDLPPQKIEIGVNVKAAQGSEATVDGVNSSGPASTIVRTNTGNIMTGAPG